MELAGYRKFFSAGLLIIAAVVALAVCIPVTSAMAAGYDRVPGIPVSPVSNVTNETLSNATLLARYQATPAPISVSVTYGETLAGAKGEMAVGPRTIGIAIDPGFLAVIVAGVVVTAGIAYIVWRKRSEEDKDDDEK